MFSFFKKPKHVREKDRIYMMRQIADQALVNEYTQLTKNGKTTLIVYFFDETANRLSILTASENCIDANQLIKNIAVRNKIKSQPNVHLVFAEHHPHAPSEQQVITELESLCENPTLYFYAALDEPFMQKFGGENVTNLMKKLGMKENEMISSTMVNNATKRAQEKIAKKVTTPISTKSQSEWMKINLDNNL